ncbi:MAG: hypothetical protein HC817_07775 [Saprospiraceae bacterium]|nr:hypothetical protein [Saprospiraceae bacterium]
MVELDAEGNLQISGLPRTNLRGITLGKAKQVLFGMFSRFYPISREDLNVFVSASRIVAVNIVGEVESPGTYTLSAGNSAFNALVAAKGLTTIGSVRNIQLIKTTGEKTAWTFMSLFSIRMLPRHFL